MRGGDSVGGGVDGVGVGVVLMVVMMVLMLVDFYSLGQICRFFVGGFP